MIIFPILAAISFLYGAYALGRIHGIQYARKVLGK